MRSDLGPAVAEVVKAIVVPGPRPDLHRKEIERLRQHWPTLASSLDALVQKVLATPPKPYLTAEQMATAIMHGAYYDGLEGQAITKDEALDIAGTLAAMVLSGELVPAVDIGNALLASIGNTPIKFWICPEVGHPGVEWDGDLATCTTCGRTNR